MIFSYTHRPVLCPGLVSEPSSGSIQEQVEKRKARQSTLEFSIGSFTSDLRNPIEREGGNNCRSQRWCSTSGKHSPLKQLGRAHRNWQAYGAAGACTRSSVHRLWLLAWEFCGTPNSWYGCIVDSFLKCKNKY